MLCFGSSVTRLEGTVSHGLLGENFLRPTGNMEDAGSPYAVTSKTSGGVIGWMESMFITMSQTFVGMPLLKLIDYFLYVAEKSSQWSLPANEISAEDNGKVFGKIELVRPLPWILFIPGLVILRIIRGGLNVGAFILGYPRVEAIEMVKFLQKSRRRLRAIHLKAAKSSRRRDKILIKSIRLSLSTLFCLDSSKLSPSPPPIKICLSGLEFETPASPDEKSTTESVGSPMLVDAKRKYSQVSSDSESETILTKLDNCASEDSMEDSDFNPANCSPQSSTSSSLGEEEKNISLTELEDIKKDNELPLKDLPPNYESTACIEGRIESSTNSSENKDTEDNKKDNEELPNRERPNALSLDKTTSDKETEGAMATNETRVDSPEPVTQSSACEKLDVNGKPHEESNDAPATPSETEAAPSPPPTQDVTDVEASRERKEEPNQKPNQKPNATQQSQFSSTHENQPQNQEKKSYPRKKQFYKQHK
ncbi:uncharacterized protein LOC143354546 [Halictus rubicundus]|uniref:uncharacterized protein LOC143354546 n=1 Tax=Halictus rubicundus TaxID=77578 RepID=UPI00403568AE